MIFKNTNTNKIYLDKYEISLKKLKLFEEKSKKLKKEVIEVNFLKKKTSKHLNRLQEIG